MFPELLEKLRRHENLSAEEAAQAMGAIMDGQADPAQIAGLLVGLAVKGERPAEMVGFATAMRDRARPLPQPLGNVFDTCGTGGDGAQTFNVSTAAAIVLAGSGLRVAKHGNRAASSRCGSADVLEALGVGLEAPAGLRRARRRGGKPRILLRAGLASVDAARRPDTARARRPNRIQPARSVDQSGGTRPADRWSLPA